MAKEILRAINEAQSLMARVNRRSGRLTYETQFEPARGSPIQRFRVEGIVHGEKPKLSYLEAHLRNHWAIDKLSVSYGPRARRSVSLSTRRPLGFDVSAAKAVIKKAGYGVTLKGDSLYVLRGSSGRSTKDALAMVLFKKRGNRNFVYYATISGDVHYRRLIPLLFGNRPLQEGRETNPRFLLSAPLPNKHLA